MTNQQGAPEALRPIQRYKIGYHTDEWGMRSSTPGGISDPSGQWVLYKDHIAALVEAQQPALTASQPPKPFQGRVERHSDQSVLVSFPSCRLASEFEQAMRGAPAPDGKPTEQVAWESTTPAYTKYVAQSRYEKFSPAVRSWYKPFKCSACAAPPAQQPAPSTAEIVELLECSGCLKAGQKDRTQAIVARLLPAQHGGVL